MTRRSAASWVFALLTGATLLTAGRLVALEPVPVPETMSVQGVLQTAGGGPATDGNYPLQFALYLQQSGGEPIWTEQSGLVGVSKGLFQQTLGKTTPLQPALQAGAAWLGVKVGSEPELPRVALASTPFALQAAAAQALQCTGCVKPGHLSADVLAPYAKTTDLQGLAKTADLAGVALSGKYGDLLGLPDLVGVVKAKDLAPVASTGSYADLKGVPDLSSYALTAKLATVATSGNYADLQEKPVLAQIGKACGTGLVLRGFAADGSLDCVAKFDPKDLPADGLDEVSNGVLSNQFAEIRTGTKDKAIADNFPAGSADAILFPDVGTAKKLTVAIAVTNSDVSKLTIELYGPGNSKPYKVYDGGKTGTALSFNLGVDGSPLSEAINKDYLAGNPKGSWSILVRDFEATTGTTDGAYNWSIAAEYIANGKVAVQGDMVVSGTITGKIASQNRNFQQVRAKGGQCYAAGGDYKAIDGLQMAITTVGGSLRITGAVTVQYGVATAIRPVVDGKYPGEFNGLPWAYLWQDGVQTTGGGLCGSYVQLEYDRLFPGIPAGKHMVGLQVYTSGTCGGNACGVLVGNGGMDGLLSAEEYY